MEDPSKMNILTLLYFPSQRQLKNETSVSIFTAPLLNLLMPAGYVMHQQV